MSEFDLGKATQDFFSALGVQVSSWNPSETIEKVSADLKKVPVQIQEILLAPPTIYMTAEELKKKSVDDLYRQVKQKVVDHRYDCQFSHTFVDVSDQLIETLVEKLSCEGFDVETEKKDKNVELQITW